MDHIRISGISAQKLEGRLRVGQQLLKMPALTGRLLILDLVERFETDGEGIAEVDIWFSA